MAKVRVKHYFHISKWSLDELDQMYQVPFDMAEESEGELTAGQRVIDDEDGNTHGLTEAAYNALGYFGYEHAFVSEIDTETGKYNIVEIDGRKVADE